jgi:hypothetical protein
MEAIQELTNQVKSIFEGTQYSDVITCRIETYAEGVQSFQSYGVRVTGYKATISDIEYITPQQGKQLEELGFKLTPDSTYILDTRA